MGCCAMESAVPDVIIPDPKGPSNFYVQELSTFSSDYEVFQDPGYENKWLVIDKQGSIWEDKCTFTVENYVRAEDNGIGSGECLAKCKLDQLSSDNFKYYDYSWDAEHFYDDSDDSDGYSSSGSEDDYAGSEIKQKCKFKASTKAKFYADRNMTQPIGSCKIKGKGKCKRKTIIEQIEDQDGNTREHRSYKFENKLKKFIYKLKLGDDEGDFNMPIKIHGSWNKRQPLDWTSDLFDARIDGFWSAKPTIETKSESMPAMDLLIGFMVCNVLGPDNVLHSCNPPFAHV